MRTGLFRTLLLIALLALTGQGLAAPCGADGAMPAGASVSDSCQSMTMDMEHAHQNHGCHGDSGAPDCHCCAGGLPAQETAAALVPHSATSTAYRPFDSSPEPELALRPPIRS